MIRKNIEKKLLVSLLSVVLVVSGCPTAQQWFQIAGALLPIIGQTYLQFYGFAQKGGVDAGDIALVQTLTTSGQDILNKIGGPNGLLATYEANKSASTVAQINALLAQAQQDVNSFLTDAQIKNSAKFAQYSAFANALLTDIQDVIGIIPVFVPAPGTTARTGQAVPGTIVARASLAKASGLKPIFEERLASLPK